MKKNLLSICALILSVFFIQNVKSQTYTFTNCGATGRFGPTQAQVNATYTGANPLTGNVTINTQGIQEWSVPANGVYTIEVRGAQGGVSPTFFAGGNGARMIGEFTFTAGQLLKIAVGQQGQATTDNEGAGGGGGSFVVDAANNPIIIAGGGGGGARNVDANTVGVTGITANNGLWGGNGGTGGQGGNCGPCTSIGGGGGGGVLTNGSNGSSRPSTGGLSFLNGLIGGQNEGPAATGGGFGGAGGGANNCGYGGGGGGYSGGGPGGWNGGCGGSGGGGASFNSGINQSNTAGFNTGNGIVIITLLCPSSAPTITCPANISVNNDAGNCSAVVNYTPPSNPCATTVTQTAGLPSGSAFPVGVTTNTFQATNAFGSTTCSFTVTVTDNENPTITCPADVTINTDAGVCTSTASIGTATGTDNCGSPTITNDAPASFPIGNTTVTWTSTDASSNFVTCTQVVTVVDNENPTITCPADITINTDAGVCTSTAAIGTATGTDNCGTPTITNDAPASFPIGNTTVTWTSTDASSNFVTCTQVVTVVDNENPTITCPADITINTDAGVCTSTAAIGTATGTDNCGTPTITNDAPASFPIGNTTVTWTSTDASSNFVTCTQVVTVVDNENPTITCPADITINTDAGVCTSTAAIGTATGTDNCGVPTITNDAPASFPIGNTTVTWTSTDASSNFVTCTQVVTVVDNENPTITCPADITINTDAGVCTSTAAIGTATGTDNCGTPTITNDAPASFPIGNTTVTWTSTDASSNFVTCTQVVTVVDNENPTITCPNDTIVGNTPGLCGAVVNYTAPVGTDNCTGATTILVSGLASGSTFPVGTTTVVYAVVDGSNNGDTCSFNVTVADSIAPTAVCQDITIHLDNTGNASILAADVDGGSSDDCAIDTLTLSQYNFTCSAIGINNVTLYVTDTYGNIDSCTAIVTVMDTVAPTVLCQNINVYVDNAGNASITTVDIDGGSNDACGIANITLSQNSFTCSDLGLNNVTLYVEDNNGNIDSCVAQVTVYDSIAPTITCPTNQEVSTDNTCIYEIVDYTSLATASMDNCDMNNVIITQMPAAGTLVTADNIINDKGQTVVTIIVEDLSGNADTCEFIVDVTCIDALTIPNVFTPNGDGKNDLWNIAGKENYPDMKVKVFNRWGDLMFESESGYNNPWDGKYNNTEAPSATYYYIILLGDGEEDLSGTINIVR